jgi:tRNA nucleotidyltransferase (CCA-adding enzyme)
MKNYRVGGSVRDGLLGLPHADEDWVVVGAIASDMIGAGFILRDEQFQVYLHPETGHEYALARIERKMQSGHRGFSLEFGKHVSLEEDLARRDLTVNAIASDESGELVDPHGGLLDLKAKVLRHVTPAFDEDPLRVWRVAGFQARLDHLNFTIAPDTHALIRVMVEREEFLQLSDERVWREVQKVAVAGVLPAFFRCAATLGIFDKAHTELASTLGSISLAGIEADDFNGEIPASADLDDLLIAFALRAEGLEKNAGAALLGQLGAPVKLRSAYDLSAALMNDEAANSRDPSEILALLERFDAMRRTERFTAALRRCAKAQEPHSDSRWIRCLFDSMRAVSDADLSSLREAVGTGNEKAALAKRLKLEAITRQSTS